MWLLGGCGGQKRVSDPLGLELQMGVSHFVGAGDEPRSAAREAGLLSSEPCLQSLLPFQGTFFPPALPAPEAVTFSPPGPQGAASYATPPRRQTNAFLAWPGVQALA